MDPLSVTLAVVSITSSVKDMVELGQKIHESFARVSQNITQHRSESLASRHRAQNVNEMAQVSNNLRNAQRVAEDIKEMVEEIQAFCQDHKVVLDDMREFCLALQALLNKFRSFETSILPLLPQTGGRRRDRLIRGWDAWRNSKKVEGGILDLQNHLVKLMRKYMMKSTMRTEVKLETIRQQTSRGLKDISQGLEVVRRDVSALHLTAARTTTTDCSYAFAGITSDEFNHNITMFAKSTPSTSAPMLRTPHEITEEFMTTAYIKFQVNRIVVKLERVSTLPASAPNRVPPQSFENSHLDSIPEHASMCITHLRRHVVRQATSIHDLLDIEHIHTISIDTGASALNKLSVGLETLSMGHESILVGKWAIMLARMLVDASSGKQPDLGANLVLYLLNQSVKYDNGGDKAQSLQAIEEAYTITRGLQNRHGVDTHRQILYSNVLLQYARLVDNQRSIEMSLEAVQVLEDILDVQAFTRSKSPEKVERVVQPDSSFLGHLFSSDSPVTAITNYAQALQSLGAYLFINGHRRSAVDLALLAISVRRKMVSIHGHECRVHLAMALSSLMLESGTANCIPGEQLVELAEECIQILRVLAVKNPLSFARQLVFVLWEKASTLESLDRDSEAIATWEEVANVAEQIVLDSELCATALDNLSDQFRRLERYDDAVRSRALAIKTHQHGAVTEAERYLYLSEDLQYLQRYKESAEAARTSVALYRRLAMKDPSKWMSCFTAALSNLAHCLAASGDCSEALISWKESVGIVDNFLNTNLDTRLAVIDTHLSALVEHPFLSYGHILEDKEQCLEICSTAVRYLRRLSDIYRHNEDMIATLLLTEFCYAYNMIRVGHLQDAQIYIGHWFDVWSSRPEAISESDFAVWHVLMVTLKAQTLDAQGCTEQALLAHQKGQNIAMLSASAHEPSLLQLVRSMVCEARLRVKLGNSDDGLQIAERALQLSRDSKLEPIVRSLVCSLHGVATIALSCQNYKRAVEAAQEACDICASPDWENSDSERNIFVRPSLFAILSSSEANLGRRGTAVEYAYHAVNASLDIRDMRLYVSATTAEQSYMETHGNLADILLATGDLAQAREIYEEQRAYFSKRVEQRIGDYRELAPVLFVLGILYCSAGYHEDGDAVAKELSQIMRTTGSAFPSLQEQVKNQLHNRVKVPIFSALNDMNQKLACKHQIEVVSFFTI